jgi:glycopeptide antibiotics resistance protein
MGQNSISPPGRFRPGGLCLTYGLLMLYASTAVGPSGVNFVYTDPVETFRHFLATPYAITGSDQRADWMGNLLMLVPFGFLMTGTLWPSRPVLKLPAAVFAFLVSVATILTIKYCQLFFPPRTVTLNYIAAQTVGAVVGCGGFVLFHQWIGVSVRRRDPVAGLVVALRLYLAALAVFLLMPLDFALDAADLRAQIERLPDTVLALPGGGRPLAVRLILILTAAAAFVPVGMLLTLVRQGVYRVGRGLLSVAGLGLGITVGLFVVSAPVISAFPLVPSVFYRTGGIVAGAAMLRWIVRQEPNALRQRLRRLIPWAVLPYLACLLVVNRLVSTHWLSLHEALTQAYSLGLLPLWDYYIVTKGEAAKNIVGHAVMYMPVGAMLWLRFGNPGARWAFAVAAGLSFLVEAARYFRPGLEGDFNAVAIAGLAAMLATLLMPVVWSMIEALGRHAGPPPARNWDRRGRRGEGEALEQAPGEIEHL